MLDVILKRFDAPDETRLFDRQTLIVNLLIELKN